MRSSIKLTKVDSTTFYYEVDIPYKNNVVIIFFFSSKRFNINKRHIRKNPLKPFSYAPDKSLRIMSFEKTTLNGVEVSVSKKEIRKLYDRLKKTGALDVFIDPDNPERNILLQLYDSLL